MISTLTLTLSRPRYKNSGIFDSGRGGFILFQPLDKDGVISDRGKERVFFGYFIRDCFSKSFLS